MCFEYRLVIVDKDVRFTKEMPLDSVGNSADPRAYMFPTTSTFKHETSDSITLILRAFGRMKRRM